MASDFIDAVTLPFKSMPPLPTLSLGKTAAARQQAIMDANQQDTTYDQDFGNSDLILSVRGTFYWVALSQTSSPGMYAIDELTRFLQERVPVATGGPVTQLDAGPQTPVLLTSIEISQSDITSEIPCLNNVKVFYTFGQNFGQVQIAGEVLLGPMGASARHQLAFQLLRDFFYTYRVSRHKLPVAVSIAREPFFVFLKGMKIGQVDPNYHVMPFVLTGSLLDISREDAMNLNPSSTVANTGNIDSASLFSALMATAPEELTVDTGTEDATSTNKSNNPNNITGKAALTADGTIVAMPKTAKERYAMAMTKLNADKKGNGALSQPEILLTELNKERLKTISDHQTEMAQFNTSIWYGANDTVYDAEIKAQQTEVYERKMADLTRAQDALATQVITTYVEPNPPPPMSEEELATEAGKLKNEKNFEEYNRIKAAQYKQEMSQAGTMSAVKASLDPNFTATEVDSKYVPDVDTNYGKYSEALAPTRPGNAWNASQSRLAW